MPITPEIFVFEASKFKFLCMYALCICRQIIYEVSEIYLISQPYLFLFGIFMSITPEIFAERVINNSFNIG